MQPHQYALAAGIALLVTLVALPFLLAMARSRAYELGMEDGKAIANSILKLQLKEARNAQQTLQVELQRTQQDCTQQLDARLANIEALKGHIAELEERIMSYTGLPVTRADYDLLISAAESLELAEKTWKALPGTEPGRKRAAQQQQDIQALAMRVHFQLRSTPATAAKMEVAA
ncbi:hypothetical protein BLX42_01900 [Pseudomonas sp. SG-MS2]|uniref:hypothetical protein n=1 Tax=Pseudomonas sp. SG-MS2 TaxID=1914534 RepID=UPI001379ABDD|nr:hypothetical protein [Pseudomonas sp. SG-MS2]KAF1312726.1 hypothetical protein BLX42_01900 [Pseudomonas sp. SG-MS2]